jgi:hypothetical protein
MNFKPEPRIVKPFSDAVFKEVQEHVHQIRKCFDWPGLPYHDLNEGVETKFNRWFWHNLPVLRSIHQSVPLRIYASELFGMALKPSYCFLSMYGPEGVCPPHTDRPQCQFTIDLLVRGGEEWPIYVEEKPYILQPGEALCYSGTGQKHYRKPMKEDSRATYANLAFFHWVPEEWMGALD